MIINYRIYDQDYKIVLIEEYPCSSYSELFKREGHYQLQNYSLCVNILIANKREQLFKNYRLDNDYICSCGKLIINTYKSRRSHAQSEQHKLKIKEVHLMILKNPDFEIPVIKKPEFDLKTGKTIDIIDYPEFDLKTGKTIDIFY